MEKITKIWLLVLFLSCITFTFGWLEEMASLSVLILLFITFMKGFYISEIFMELSEVRLKYRIIPIVWLIGILFFIALTYCNTK